MSRYETPALAPDVVRYLNDRYDHGDKGGYKIISTVPARGDGDSHVMIVDRWYRTMIGEPHDECETRVICVERNAHGWRVRFDMNA
jgi:hypothetical protein